MMPGPAVLVRHWTALAFAGAIVATAIFSSLLTSLYYSSHMHMLSIAAAQRENSKPAPGANQFPLSCEASREAEPCETEDREQLPTLKDVWDNHAGYISVKWSNYLLAYEEELTRIRAHKRAVSVLEIGVGTGGSLQIWRKFFGAEAQIVGLDINPKACTDLVYEAGITVHCMDVMNTEAVEKLFELQRFDVIIDDAGHSSESLVTSFSMFFPKLNPGGVFALEDIGGVYGSDGYQKKATGFMKFMKDLADLTNLHMIVWQLKGVPAAVTDFQLEVGMWIDSISFRENLVIVRKHWHSRANAFDVLQAGHTRAYFVYAGDEATNGTTYFNHVLRYQNEWMRDISLKTRVT